MAHVSVPKYWHSFPQKYRLIAGKCKNCGFINFPPLPLCVKCNKENTQENIELKGQGKVFYLYRLCDNAPPSK